MPAKGTKSVKETKKPVEKKAAIKKETVAKTMPVKKTTGGLVVEVMDVKGKVVESMELPKEIFGAKVNHKLLSQAVRVYLANQRMGTASTKTRGEVDGSTRKIYRQKGTGRARHGGIRAPIFVKGGIAHGPKPKDYTLTLPKAMRKAALSSALSAKAHANEVSVIVGLGKAEPKTKVMADALGHVGYNQKGTILLVLPEHMVALHRSVRNLAKFSVSPVSQLHTYDVLRATRVVFMKEAIEKMQKGENHA